MREMRLPLGLILAGTFLAGCAAGVSQTGPQAADNGPLKLFANANGYGNITMRVIDMRKGRSTQAVADADKWDKVDVRINSLKLRQPRVATMSYELGVGPFSSLGQLNYSVPKMAQLPPANDYTVLVTLATGSATVGQGSSSSIMVQAGETKTVTIYINAVGQMTFFSTDYFTATGSVGVASSSFGFPELVENTGVDLQTAFPNATGSAPEQTFGSWTYDIKNDTGTSLIGGSPATVSVGVSSLTFTVPPAGASELIGHVSVYGYNTLGATLSVKTRSILIMRGGSIDAHLE